MVVPCNQAILYSPASLTKGAQGFLRREPGLENQASSPGLATFGGIKLVKKLASISCSVLLSVFLVGSTGVGRAQQPDASVETSRFDSWTVRCVTEDQRRCQLFQQVFVQQNDQRRPIMSVTVTDDRLRMQLPLGLNLREAIKLSVGSYEVSVPYTVCTQQGCYAGEPTDDTMIAAFRRGETMKITLTRLDGEAVELDLSLLGFTQAYATMQGS